MIVALQELYVSYSGLLLKGRALVASDQTGFTFISKDESQW
jgi:hypothetical protein